jgi:hypothetical protein
LVLLELMVLVAEVEALAVGIQMRLQELLVVMVLLLFVTQLIQLKQKS